MADNITVLITGPNRALLEKFLARSNTTVVAGVRDPAAEASQQLSNASTAQGSKLVVVKIDSATDGDAKAAVAELQSKHGVDRLDVVIANAGHGERVAPVLDSSPDNVRNHLNVNLIGVLTLFQATEPLLRKSNAPKFFAMSSNLGSLGVMTALNYLTRKIHFENEWLTAVALSPGWVQTDMGQLAADAVGMEAAPLKLEDSVKGLVQVVSWDRR
ncbi:hypothetical protein SLS60_003612 [Paraconiothyrium brasiliense]|uniref:Uncharacterized protein n=1 Tax=Paraconiothyrium brasiliense TaxID=300254 RepID=A0ABR3RP49_9PLEO